MQSCKTLSWLQIPNVLWSDAHWEEKKDVSKQCKFFSYWLDISAICGSGDIVGHGGCSFWLGCPGLSCWAYPVQYALCFDFWRWILFPFFYSVSVAGARALFGWDKREGEKRNAGFSRLLALLWFEGFRDSRFRGSAGINYVGGVPSLRRRCVGNGWMMGVVDTTRHDTRASTSN